LTQGPKVSAFEAAMCDYTGAKYAVAVSNGTAALHVLMLAAGIKKGDEFITSPNTFLASANAGLYVGATPKLADIDAASFNITPDSIKAQLSEKTKVIIPVHFAGLPCDMRGIAMIAKQKNLFVIEDGCHALGGSYNGDKVGACTYSDATIFSFHPVKSIATGEGGMITTNDKALYEKLLLLRSHGVTKDPEKITQNVGVWYYEMQCLGYNYRMSDIQAALGISQLKKLPSFLKRRHEIVARYNEAFKGVDWIKPPAQFEDRDSGNHLYVLQINFDAINKSRDDVMKELQEKGVGTQVHYIPLYHQPYYHQFGFQKESFPNTEAYYENALSIPLYPKMTDTDLEKVINSVIGLRTV